MKVREAMQQQAVTLDDALALITDQLSAAIEAFRPQLAVDAGDKRNRARKRR
jgi:hypothetical protein